MSDATRPRSFVITALAAPDLGEFFEWYCVDPWAWGRVPPSGSGRGHFADVFWEGFGGAFVARGIAAVLSVAIVRDVDSGNRTAWMDVVHSPGIGEVDDGPLVDTTLAWARDALSCRQIFSSSCLHQVGAFDRSGIRPAHLGRMVDKDFHDGQRCDRRVERVVLSVPATSR